MKKVLLLVVTLLIALTCALTSVANAATMTAANYQDSYAYKFVKDFCEKYPNRKAGINVNNPAENGLQKYLTEQIVAMSNGVIAASEVKYIAFHVSEINLGYNIEARINKSGSDKQIIIGAHYDSEGTGANDNASGVAALLMVMKELSRDVSRLPCNVVFVLFDDEESGMHGSYDYVANMSDVEKESTLVMFNMDSIANGDNLYVWCENKRTDLAKLILSKSDKLAEKPYAKGTYNLDYGYGYGYIETPQNSDHTPFRVQGIPTALFFSGTYSAAPWNYSESVNPAKNTMNTANDAFTNLDTDSQIEFVAKIEATASVVSQTVLDDDFAQVAANQRKQLVNLNVWGNDWWARLIGAVLAVAAIILALLYYRKLQKRAILGTAEIKNTKVFSTPDANDIFTFDSNKSKDTKPAAEDIFTFDDKK